MSLFFGTSFGTPNTLPLREMLQRDNAMAFPASLSSAMAEHQQTPPLAPNYAFEAERAMDYLVESAGGADKIKAGIVYQKDDYGEDGLKGWKAAAARHGVKIVSEQTIAPGQKDMAAVTHRPQERRRHARSFDGPAFGHRADCWDSSTDEVHACLGGQTHRPGSIRSSSRK